MVRVIQADNWFGMNIRHFLLLSNLCHMIDDTAKDAVSRLNLRSLVTLNVPTRTKLEVEVGETFNQTMEDLIVTFELLVNTSHLWTQIDEPFQLSSLSNYEHNLTTKFTIIRNKSNTQQMPQVSERDSSHR